MKKITLFILFLLFAMVNLVQAQATLSIQGVIKNSDGTAVENGNYSLTFKLYNTASGGTPIWSETQGSVPVTGGIYSALLGDSEPLTAAFNEVYYLGVAVDGGAEMVPRAKLTSSPYALGLIGNSNVFASDGNVGIGTVTPSEKLEVIGNLKVDGNVEFTGNVVGNLGIDHSNLTEDVSTTQNINAGGNVTATGDVTLENGLHAPAAQEQLRMVRGTINLNGTVNSGTDFTCTRTGTGTFRITFSSDFTGIPSVIGAIKDNWNLVVSTRSINNSSFEVGILNPNNDQRVDAPFSFIAIGPR